MDTTNDEAALFNKEVAYWQRELGLTDWTIQIKIEAASQGQTHEADADYDCETRHCKMLYFTGVEDSLHPSDVACHEVLHLLFADAFLVALQARDESDPLLAREEHKVIERLLKVLGKVRRK